MLHDHQICIVRDLLVVSGAGVDAELPLETCLREVWDYRLHVVDIANHGHRLWLEQSSDRIRLRTQLPAGHDLF